MVCLQTSLIWGIGLGIGIGIGIGIGVGIGIGIGIGIGVGVGIGAYRDWETDLGIVTGKQIGRAHV